MPEDDDKQRARDRFLTMEMHHLCTAIATHTNLFWKQLIRAGIISKEESLKSLRTTIENTPGSPLTQQILALAIIDLEDDADINSGSPPPPDGSDDESGTGGSLH